MIAHTPLVEGASPDAPIAHDTGLIHGPECAPGQHLWHQQRDPKGHPAWACEVCTATAPLQPMPNGSFATLQAPVAGLAGSPTDPNARRRPERLPGLLRHLFGRDEW